MIKTSGSCLIPGGPTLRPVYSDTTQLNVELSCVGKVSIATQLNSTDLLRADWLYSATGSAALPIVGDSRVASVRVSIVTELNSTRRRVELCQRSVYSDLLTQLNSTRR